MKIRLSNNSALYKVLSWGRLYFMAICYRVPLYIFSFFPIKTNKITVVNYSGKGYGDNAKYICDKLLGKGYDIIWATNDNNTMPKEIRTAKYNSVRYFYHLATSKIWINNSRFYYGTTKRDGQYYIQTWHSSLRLKKIEKDAEDSLSPRYIATCKADSRMIDLMISGSDFSTKIYKNSFWYTGKVKRTGTPRCDVLLDDTYAKKSREIINRIYQTEDKKIILYAPTFRRKKEDEKYYLDCKRLSQKLGDDYKILVRMHPISKYKVDETKNTINVTKYSDMQELLMAADFLITDYSGCSFDMMIAKKPCILYTPDLEQYLAKERDLYFDINKLPFPNTKDIDDLAKVIKNFDNTAYLRDIEMFSKKIGLKEDGKASERIAKIIIDKINE